MIIFQEDGKPPHSMTFCWINWMLCQIYFGGFM